MIPMILRPNNTPSAAGLYQASLNNDNNIEIIKVTDSPTGLDWVNLTGLNRGWSIRNYPDNALTTDRYPDPIVEPKQLRQGFFIGVDGMIVHVYEEPQVCVLSTEDAQYEPHRKEVVWYEDAKPKPEA